MAFLAAAVPRPPWPPAAFPAPRPLMAEPPAADVCVLWVVAAPASEEALVQTARAPGWTFRRAADPGLCSSGGTSLPRALRVIMHHGRAAVGKHTRYIHHQVLGIHRVTREEGQLACMYGHMDGNWYGTNHAWLQRRLAGCTIIDA